MEAELSPGCCVVESMAGASSCICNWSPHSAFGPVRASMSAPQLRCCRCLQAPLRAARLHRQTVCFSRKSTVACTRSLCHFCCTIQSIWGIQRAAKSRASSSAESHLAVMQRGLLRDSVPSVPPRFIPRPLRP
jgi:hypothetical protein